jgi:FkbH-like protein
MRTAYSFCRIAALGRRHDRSTSQRAPEACGLIWARRFSALLQSLDTEITVARFEPSRIGRTAQLFQRSNQFNLTTRRRSDGDCEELMRDASCYPLYAELRDRLGNHGLTSIVVCRDDGDGLLLSDWLMSCRVLTRGVEQFLMNRCVEYAASRNRQCLTGEYRRTPRTRW